MTEQQSIGHEKNISPAVDSKNIISIDLLRAVAALGVFLYHTHIGALIEKYFGISFFITIDTFGAYYAVPWFFLLSGYCIHASNVKFLKSNRLLPLREYYKRRFFRIYPAYIVALVFSIFTNYIIDHNYKLDNVDVLFHLFLLQGFSVPYFNTINVVLWTISVELAFYIIYPLFYYVRLKRNLTVALSFVFVVSCISITYYETKETLNITEYYCVFNLWFAWCCGAFLAEKKILSPGDLKRPLYIYIYSAIIGLFIYFEFFSHALSIVAYQVKILFWTAPTMLFISKEKWLKKKENLRTLKILVAIGLSSYSLYLLHQPLTAFKNLAVHKFLPLRFQMIGLIVGILVVPLVAWLNYQFVEKPFLARRNVAKN